VIHAKLVVDTLWVSAYPIDPTALMDDAPFKGLLRTNIFLRQVMIGLYRNVEKRILALQGMIEQELAGRE